MQRRNMRGVTNPSTSTAMTGPDLAAARKRRGVLQQELADRMGVSRQTLSTLEGKGVVRAGKVQQYLAALATFPDVTTPAEVAS